MQLSSKVSYGYSNNEQEVQNFVGIRDSVIMKQNKRLVTIIKFTRASKFNAGVGAAPRWRRKSKIMLAFSALLCHDGIIGLSVSGRLVLASGSVKNGIVTMLMLAAALYMGACVQLSSKVSYGYSNNEQEVQNFLFPSLQWLGKSFK